jgi:2-polyprenyl-3-methyl-5-hydroxy-6-metoxy-1,4-benzoquinol methylase
VDDRVSVNRLRWNEMATLHETTYAQGGDVVNDAELKPFEIEELGVVRGQRICHLQCHIGGDSISLARLGASVVGVDFSDKAIEIARRRVAQAALQEQVEFVCAAVDDAADLVEGDFDGVYTSWGVLCWLPSLDSWARTIVRLLRDGGWLYLAETHPAAIALRSPSYPYGGATAVYDDAHGDYTKADAIFEHPASWEWTHSLGEIVTAVAEAGLRIEWLHEHPYLAWHLNDQQNLRRCPDGLWEDPRSTLPLSFSLRATKS